MRATWLANEIKSASLKLKPSEGSEAPERLRIGYVESAYGTFITRAKASGMVDLSSLSTVDVIAGEDGWISVDVTGFVKGWLSGEVPNYGFAIFGDEEGEFLFEAVDWTENGESFPYPYLEVSGAVGERVSGYGKFGYTEAPLPGAAADQGGNCLAYALRDTNMILADDLEINLGETNKIYSESGEDGVAEYAAGLVEKYVEAHKDGLKVSGFRRIDDFDSPIDASKEYRIAFRVGCKVYEGFEVDLSEEGAFDFHLWVQLNDGRWAQKFPLDPSEIVPGSGAGVSPAKYPWDSALMWLEKFQGYYTSKVIYYAVVKDAEGLTQHKSM
jgi:hypothetical protein